jgi:hypothetical protein
VITLPRKKAITAVPIKSVKKVAKTTEVVVPKVIEDEDPILAARSILSARGLYGIQDAITYLEGFVWRHPDIDPFVDRSTERAAMSSYQTWLSTDNGQQDEVFLDTHWQRWGVLERKAVWLRRWLNIVDGEAEPPTHEPRDEPRTYEEAFAQARKEGWLPPADQVEEARQALEQQL